ATKFMPASTPAFGIPKVALVMARMIVDGQDRGSRFFIVPICDEREMYRGKRGGKRSGEFNSAHWPFPPLGFLL
ncbi:hypothetical protein MPER_16134, partial [Moniliophthora perniciosa FA553]